MNADSGASGRLPDDQINLVVEVFRMLADATRVHVLWLLADRELSVNELADQVGKPAPSVSQHLAKLRMARLVRTRRAGTTIYYSLENDHVRRLVVDAVFNAEHAGPGVPPHHRDNLELRMVAPDDAEKATISPTERGISLLNTNTTRPTCTSMSTAMWRIAMRTPLTDTTTSNTNTRTTIRTGRSTRTPTRTPDRLLVRLPVQLDRCGARVLM